jgi:hypothetical protein
LRGTKIHPKKPAFLRPIKSFIFLKYMYMTRLHLLPSRISKFSGGVPPPTKRTHPVACPVSAYFQKFSIYLNLFENPACAFCQIFSNQGVIVVIVILI